MHSSIKYLVAISTFLIMACGAEKKKQNSLDLLQYGMPISILAPERAVIEHDDLGVMKDLTVKAGEDYFVQIFSSTASSTQAENIKKVLIESVKQEPYFSEIIQDDAHGFIYVKELAKDKLDYDFRFVKVQGDTEFIFQTGLYGTFSEESVRNMYASVK